MRSAKSVSNRSSSTRSFAALSWLIPWGKTATPQSGPVIRRSWNKTLQKMSFAGLAAAAGVGITCVSIGGASQAWSKKPDYLILILLALAAFALIGLCLLALGAALVFMYALSLYHKERLILGKTCLQCLFGATKANMQLPFDNIRKIALGTKTEPNGVAYPYIGIDLVDPTRDDTIINPVALKSNRQDYGCDQIIFDDYELPLATFFDQLVARWKKATREADADEDDDDESPPRPKNIKRRA